ncbi:MAG: UDP-N-acetylmuramoyl-L-alanine--D-glutamate ligase, partial [Neisseriaceae bacterium]|nr:UDP-N-acetylmuramoyl-L-alanine--D-glutamate ligase [Neisseriaceae bacterium]
MEFKNNQRFLVLGLQKTGKSVLRFLQQKEQIILSGYAKSISDQDRADLAQAFPRVFFYSGELKEILFSNRFDCLVLSPGFSIYLPEIQEFIQSGGQVTGDIQLWLEHVKKPQEKLIAITGSNGKSTVTELVGYLCRESGMNT